MRYFVILHLIINLLQGDTLLRRRKAMQEKRHPNVRYSVTIIYKLNNLKRHIRRYWKISRGGPWTAATSKMKHFVIIVNGWRPVTIITKSSILDVAAVLDPPLIRVSFVKQIEFIILINTGNMLYKVLLTFFTETLMVMSSSKLNYSLISMCKK